MTSLVGFGNDIEIKAFYRHRMHGQLDTCKVAKVASKPQWQQPSSCSTDTLVVFPAATLQKDIASKMQFMLFFAGPHWLVLCSLMQ